MERDCGSATNNVQIGAFVSVSDTNGTMNFFLITLSTPLNTLTFFQRPSLIVFPSTYGDIVDLKYLADASNRLLLLLKPHLRYFVEFQMTAASLQIFRILWTYVRKYLLSKYIRQNNRIFNSGMFKPWRKIPLFAYLNYSYNVFLSSWDALP